MRTFQAVLTWAAVGSTAWLAVSCNVPQPLPQCTVGRGSHAVRYTVKSSSGACAPKPSEIVGAQSFRFPEDPGKAPILALKPATLAALESNDTTLSATSTGDFLSEYPSAEDVCEIPSLSEGVAAEAPAGGGEPVQVRYQWSGIRVSNTAAIPGTQWKATLDYTRGDCTATYEAVGVFPAISCRTSTGQIDENLCNQPRPGLSLDPAFPVRCDTDSGLCVLAENPPALKR